MDTQRPVPPVNSDTRDYKERVVQWGEQLILKDYVLHVNHWARYGMWSGPSPLAVTYDQALLIHEALRNRYPHAFEVEGTPCAGAPPAVSDDESLPPLADDEEASPGPVAEHHDDLDPYIDEDPDLAPTERDDVMSDTEHAPLNGAVTMDTSPYRHEPEELSTATSETDAPSSRNVDYSNTVHYEDDPFEDIHIAREVVFTDPEWPGEDIPSLHVYSARALLKLSEQPVVEFGSSRSLRAMAALCLRAARELERSE